MATSTRTRTTRAARRVDAAWFSARIAESRYRSGRKLAPHVRGLEGPLTSASLSLLINGKRAMRIEEARQLADLLEQPLAEILRHAGVDVGDLGDDIEVRHRAAVRMVGTLLAFIDEAGVAVPARVRNAATAIASAD